MKARYLFPYWCKYLGWFFVIVHIPIMALTKATDSGHYRGYNTGENTPFFSHDHWFFIGTALLVAIGLFLVAFSKERIEDEQINQLRSDSLQWAIYLNYALLVATLIISEDREHILFLNLWIPLAFFIIRFRWKIWQLNRLVEREQA